MLTEQEIKALELARSILRGETGILEGCRSFVPFLSDLDINNSVKDVFRAVDSESDHLPLGAVRIHWSPNSLVEKDKEAEAYAAKVRPMVIEACKLVITQLQEKIE